MTQRHSVRPMVMPSSARILRIEISNPGLPGTLTDLITSRKANSYQCEFLYRRQLFQEEHDNAVRHYLGVSDDAKMTFEKYIKHYFELKKKYVRNILCYGNFILSDDLPEFVVEAKAFSQELDDLRLNVRLFLRDKLHLKWDDILRFNPRLRYATFLLSEALVMNHDFRKQILHMRKPFNASQDVDYLLGTENG